MSSTVFANSLLEAGSSVCSLPEAKLVPRDQFIAKHRIPLFHRDLPVKVRDFDARTHKWGKWTAATLHSAQRAVSEIELDVEVDGRTECAPVVSTLEYAVKAQRDTGLAMQGPYAVELGNIWFPHAPRPSKVSPQQRLDQLYTVYALLPAEAEAPARWEKAVLLEASDLDAPVGTAQFRVRLVSGGPRTSIVLVDAIAPIPAASSTACAAVSAPNVLSTLAAALAALPHLLAALPRALAKGLARAHGWVAYARLWVRAVRKNAALRWAARAGAGRQAVFLV